jgi:hypothetical protein
MSRRAFRDAWRLTARWQVALWLCVALSLSWASPVDAANRASLDRNRIALDETVVLTIDVDASDVRNIPDVNALVRDFMVVDHSSQPKPALVNGVIDLRIIMRLRLRPMREGEIVIPFDTGNGPPLRVTVTPPRNAAALPKPSTAAAQPAQMVFFDSRVETATPYAQQSVGYTLRMYYDMTAGVNGRIDQDTPDGASLKFVGEDALPLQQIAGRFYNVHERRYVLIPERGGRLVVPPPRFLGRGMDPTAGAFGRSEELRVSGRALELQVKPIPAAAAQPWLPLRSLRLRYLQTPPEARVGETALITVEAVADGAVAAQLPALTVQVGDGAQVFPESAQSQDRFVDGGAEAAVVRRFAVLPSREGTLRIAGPRIAWWDAQAGVARTASLPDLVLQVGPSLGTASPSATGPRSAAAGDDMAAPAWRRWVPDRPWMWMLVPLSALWVITLLFGWRMWSARKRWNDTAPAPVPASAPASATSRPAGASSSSSGAPPSLSRPDAQAWARTLARGDRGDIARMLCAMASPPAADLDEVRERLADPSQRAAVRGLQRARWGLGDPAAATAAVRIAFADGPRWREREAPAAAPLLPPLYPGA